MWCSCQNLSPEMWYKVCIKVFIEKITIEKPYNERNLNEINSLFFDMSKKESCSSLQLCWITTLCVCAHKEFVMVDTFHLSHVVRFAEISYI